MEDYRNGLNPPDLIRSTIAGCAQTLTLPNINSVALLTAFANVETNFGEFDIPRYEPAYGHGGIWYKKSKMLQADYLLFGPLVACSYSPFQIMYGTARDLGFVGNPLALWNVSVALPYVVKYLSQKYKEGATTVPQLAQAYNSGGFRGLPVAPVQLYMNKLEQNYDRILLSKNK